jgi:glycosyltransferase involved in cell wall biosynthesis
LLYVSLPDGPAVSLLLPVLIAARLARRRVAVHHESFAYLGRPRWDHRLVLAIVPQAEHIVLCSRMEELLRARYGSVDKVYVIGNEAFVETVPRVDEVHSQEGTGGGLVVAHLANLTIEKGLDIVLDTARHAVRTGLDLRLRIGGPVVEERARLALAAGQCDLADRLEYWGPVRQDQLDDFYRGVSVFLFPSRYDAEAQPLVVLEALARGVPCVTSEVGCLAGAEGLTTSRDLSCEELVELVRRAAGRSRRSVGLEAAPARQTLADRLPVSLAKLELAVRT